MSREVLVHGRDFTAYRIGGAIAALLLAVALVWQGWELLDGDSWTVPESHWTATGDEGVGSEDYSSGAMAAEILSARTRLQDERFRSGPSPADEPPDYAVGQGEFLRESPMAEDQGRALATGWATLDSDAAGMLRVSERVNGISSLPYANADLFERPFGRSWRWGMADFVTHLGALAILGFSFLLATVLAIRGRVPIAEGKSGRTVKRFGFVERANHWMTAVSFIGLALTGIAIAYGDTLVRPFGEDFLGGVGWISTWGHMIFFPSFTLGILVMAAYWLYGNLPSKLDGPWLARFGGFFSDDPDNPPARRFNAGQKLIFWAAFLGGLVMVTTGVLLMFPYFIMDLPGLSWVMLTHAVLAVLLIAFFIGHIYIGTVGMQGAIDAMWGGNVDRNWAAEHHELWLEELDRKQQRKGA